MKRVEKDPYGGWIARKRDGTVIFDPEFRWNTQAGAKAAALDADLSEEQDGETNTP